MITKVPRKVQNCFSRITKRKIDIVIGPVFFEHLKEISKDPNFSKYIFFSLTNETTDIPPNVISFGVNINSQIDAIKPVLLKITKPKFFW